MPAYGSSRRRLRPARRLPRQAGCKGELYRWLKPEWPTDEALKTGAGFPPGACHLSAVR
jgi:hypothetical protein